MPFQRGANHVRHAPAGPAAGFCRIPVTPQLHRAQLDFAQLEGAQLDPAHLRGADLSAAEGLTREQLSEAEINEHQFPWYPVKGPEEADPDPDN